MTNKPYERIPKGELGWYVLERHGAGAEILQFEVGKSPSDAWFSGQYGGMYGKSSAPYRTREEAEATLAHESGQPTTTCTHCGYLINFAYMNWRSLLKHKACFICDHWLSVIERDNPKRIVIDGHIYSDGGRNRQSLGTLGFGGREFHIVMNDGTEIKTNNLWSGGEIPEKWRERLPDNARFADARRWVECGDGTRCMS